jgi:hypothetical protein
MMESRQPIASGLPLCRLSAKVRLRSKSGSIANIAGRPNLTRTASAEPPSTTAYGPPRRLGAERHLSRASLYPPPEAVRAWRRVSIRLTCGRSPYLNRSMCRPPSEADATGGHELYHREANRDTSKTPAPRTCSRRGLLARGIGSDRLAWHALNLESSSCFVRSASHLPWSSCPRSRPRAELGADPHRVISSHYGKCPTIAIWPWLDAVSAARWRGPLPARRH